MNHEILLASYWEHHKAYNEFARIYPLKHPKRVKIMKELNKIAEQLAESKTKTIKL